MEQDTHTHTHTHTDSETINFPEAGSSSDSEVSENDTKGLCVHACKLSPSSDYLIFMINTEEEEEIWSMDPSSDIDDFDNETPLVSSHNAADCQSVPRSLCTWIILFLSYFEVILNIPDRAMDVFRKFMSAFFYSERVFKCMLSIASIFPLSLYRLKTYVGITICLL